MLKLDDKWFPAQTTKQDWFLRKNWRLGSVRIISCQYICDRPSAIHQHNCATCEIQATAKNSEWTFHCARQRHLHRWQPDVNSWGRDGLLNALNDSYVTVVITLNDEQSPTSKIISDDLFQHKCWLMSWLSPEQSRQNLVIKVQLLLESDILGRLILGLNKLNKIQDLTDRVEITKKRGLQIWTNSSYVHRKGDLH